MTTWLWLFAVLMTGLSSLSHAHAGHDHHASHVQQRHFDSSAGSVASAEIGFEAAALEDQTPRLLDTSFTRGTLTAVEVGDVAGAPDCNGCCGHGAFSCCSGGSCCPQALSTIWMAVDAGGQAALGTRSDVVAAGSVRYGLDRPPKA